MLPTVKRRSFAFAIALGFSLVLPGCDCGGELKPSGCRSSSDCQGGQVCIDGRCMNPPPGSDAGPRPDIYV
ncbi:MAG: hypothetical protein NZM37_04895, partial [Sandaracinaceae bacterium]|nr:hypothetical protein [Sandaracinaceae bacterium]